MFQRLSISVYDIKDSLWFRPAVMTIGAVMLAFAMLWIDDTVLGGSNLHTWWLFEGSATGARGVLSSIAGTMMTVVTMAFSITMVALQLGSSQYSPRIMRNFTGDRGNQMVLGIFIATFVYCLLVLRAVRSKEEDLTGFVPSLSITVALVLALICIGALIYFFHHATRTIQVSVILHNVATDVFNLIDKEFDVDQAHMNARTAALQESLSVVATVTAAHPGYIRGVQAGTLKSIASEHDLLLTVWSRVGDFIFTGTEMVTVQRFTGAHRDSDDTEENGNGVVNELRDAVGAVLDKTSGNGSSDAGEEGEEKSEIDALVERVRNAFTTGMERTLNEDILLGFQQLSDIGMRALSPGTNDPTTAMLAIDQIGEGLLRVRDAGTRPTVAVDEDGTPRVIFPAFPFTRFLEISVQHIRHFAASDPFVSEHLVRMLGSVESISGDSPASEALREEARRVVESVRGQNPLPSEMMMVREAAAWAYVPENIPAIIRTGPDLFDM